MSTFKQRLLAVALVSAVGLSGSAYAGTKVGDTNWWNSVNNTQTTKTTTPHTNPNDPGPLPGCAPSVNREILLQQQSKDKVTMGCVNVSKELFDYLVNNYNGNTIKITN